MLGFVQLGSMAFKGYNIIVLSDLEKIVLGHASILLRGGKINPFAAVDEETLPVGTFRNYKGF